MPIKLLSDGKRLLTLQLSRLPKLSSSLSWAWAGSGKARLPMLSISSVSSRGGFRARFPGPIRLPMSSSESCDRFLLGERGFRLLFRLRPPLLPSLRPSFDAFLGRGRRCPRGAELLFAFEDPDWLSADADCPEPAVLGWDAGNSLFVIRLTSPWFYSSTSHKAQTQPEVHYL